MLSSETVMHGDVSEISRPEGEKLQTLLFLDLADLQEDMYYTLIPNIFK